MCVEEIVSGVSKGGRASYVCYCECKHNNKGTGKKTGLHCEQMNDLAPEYIQRESYIG